MCAMLACVSCSGPLPPGGHYCPTCGAPTAKPHEYATETSAGSRVAFDSPRSPGPPRARFLPGTIVGGRYRIVGPIGRGGMGEVYRADDLKLGQSVALKFLPRGLEQDRARLARLLNEVRLALRVSHPNVCRVHDIGEADGQHYLSMEYVDGEDIASLLRRIGRLPPDKAVQVARQLCAGLAAAHEQGILHRDLKPANVMLDGRGRVKITDFGLAGLPEAIRGEDLRSGTPAYMAPEQRAGQEVTRKSDLYGLGLVLYELFTGKPAFSARESEPSTPSSHVEGIDPAVERAILRCLESDPRRRPESALAVAAALPGGDPLAAALAAGETPSPEMVAAAGAGEPLLRPAVAAACVAVLAVAVVSSLVFARRYPESIGLLGYVRAPEPPAVLVREAGRILQSLGYAEPPLDRAFGFASSYDYVRWVENNDPSPARWERLAAPRSPGLYFWYRQSPRWIVPDRGIASRVWTENPTPFHSGEVVLATDTAGHLIHLEAVAPERIEPGASSAEPDWNTLFAAAGLDAADYRTTTPVWSPPYYADRREAWERVDAGRADLPPRIEAATFLGRVVWFDDIDPWTRPARMVESGPQPGQSFLTAFFTISFAAIIAGSALLARANLRAGRGDRRGALRVAAFLGITFVGIGLLHASHVPDLNEEFDLLFRELCLDTFMACLCWLAYIALEPFLRRRWPDAMISWSRLLEGRLLDPRIGRDIVAGAAATGIWIMLSLTTPLAWRWFDVPPPLRYPDLRMLMGSRDILAAIVSRIALPFLGLMAFLFMILLLRIVLRRHWLAVSTIVLLLSLLDVFGSPVPVWSFFVSMVFWSLVLALLTWFGLLSAAAFYIFGDLVSLIPSADLNTWYSGGSIAVLLLVAAFAAFGFYTSIERRAGFPGRIVPSE
jgi:serine/threonine-protein kinase